jgi:hypothetical protein
MPSPSVFRCAAVSLPHSGSFPEAIDDRCWHSRQGIDHYLHTAGELSSSSCAFHPGDRPTSTGRRHDSSTSHGRRGTCPRVARVRDIPRYGEFLVIPYTRLPRRLSRYADRFPDGVTSPIRRRSHSCNCQSSAMPRWRVCSTLLRIAVRITHEVTTSWPISAGRPLLTWWAGSTTTTGSSSLAGCARYARAGGCGGYEVGLVSPG